MKAEDLASAMKQLPQHVQRRFQKLVEGTTASSAVVAAAVDADDSYHKCHVASALKVREMCEKQGKGSGAMI